MIKTKKIRFLLNSHNNYLTFIYGAINFACHCFYYFYSLSNNSLNK